MIRSKRAAFLFLAVVLVLAMNSLGALASTDDTTSKGYQLIDGNVCDLSGNVLIEMRNGFTPDGYALDPNFKVSYPVKSEAIVPYSATATELYNGTMSLALNTDGNQGKQVGESFKATSEEPDVVCFYRSGQPSGVNFAVVNTTRDTLVTFVPNVQPGEQTDPIPTYNSGRPSDNYRVKASAEGSAGADGLARLKVVLQ